MHIHGALVALGGMDVATNDVLREPTKKLYTDTLALLELLKEDQG